jgi:hypothetical protein
MEIKRFRASCDLRDATSARPGSRPTGKQTVSSKSPVLLSATEEEPNLQLEEFGDHIEGEKMALRDQRHCHAGQLDSTEPLTATSNDATLPRLGQRIVSPTVLQTPIQTSARLST